MKLFKDNLVAYEKSMGLASTDIAELSDLPLHTIHRMEEGKFKEEDIFTLCTKLGLDYSSIYSDGGLKQIPILDQYDKYPHDLKAIVSRAVYLKVMKILEKKGKENPVFHRTLVGRIKVGSASLTKENLELLQRSVEKDISKEYFYEILSTIMYIKISNYNLLFTKKFYKISYAEIGKALGVTTSAASNWGGTISRHIPMDKIDKFLSYIPGMNKEKFLTKPLIAKDFDKCTCMFNRVKKPDCKFDFPDPPSDDVPENIPEVAEAQKEVNEETSDVIPIDSIGKMNLTNDQALKLYTVLEPAQKQKVNNLIAQLFFG